MVHQEPVFEGQDQRGLWLTSMPNMELRLLQAIFYGILPYGHERHGILSGVLNSHPLALKHLIPALTHFYIGVFYYLRVYW